MTRSLAESRAVMAQNIADLEAKAFERGRTAGIFDVLATVRADEAMYTTIIDAHPDEDSTYTLGKRNELRNIIVEWGR